jgi:hypothetical protein
MLPLAQRRAAATVGAFHQLSPKDAKTLTDDGECCSVSWEDLPDNDQPNTKPGEDDAVFRVKHDGVDDPASYEGLNKYRFYKARALAEWVRRKVYDEGVARNAVLDPSTQTLLSLEDVNLLLEYYPATDADTLGEGVILETFIYGKGPDIIPIRVPLKDGFEYLAIAPFAEESTFSWIEARAVQTFQIELQIESDNGHFGLGQNAVHRWLNNLIRARLEMASDEDVAFYGLGDVYELKDFTKFYSDDGILRAIARSFASGLVKLSSTHREDRDTNEAIVDALIGGDQPAIRVQLAAGRGSYAASVATSLTVDISKDAMRMLVIRSRVQGLAEEHARVWKATFTPESGKPWTSIQPFTIFDFVGGEFFCWKSWTGEDAAHSRPCGDDAGAGQGRQRAWKHALALMISSVHHVCYHAETFMDNIAFPISTYDYVVPRPDQPADDPRGHGTLDDFYNDLGNVGMKLAELYGPPFDGVHRYRLSWRDAAMNTLFGSGDYASYLQAKVPIWYFVSTKFFFDSRTADQDQRRAMEAMEAMEVDA